MKAIRTGATGGLRVVVINDASLARGGATGLALLQARLLRERGIEVVFAAGDSGDNAELRAIGVDLRALGGQQLIKAPRAQAATRGIYNPAARRFIAEIVEEMADARTADAMASKGAMGIAELLIKQFGARVTATPAAATDGAAGTPGA